MIWLLQENNLIIPGDGHPNKKYHRLMGDFIADTVSWQQVL